MDNVTATDPGPSEGPSQGRKLGRGRWSQRPKHVSYMDDFGFDKASVAIDGQTDTRTDRQRDKSREIKLDR